MRPFLRIVAVVLALCVLGALVQTNDVLWRGGISTMARSGVLGAATVLGWLLILIAGPFASVQLWRLRRMGLYATAILSGFFLAYYFAAILFLQAELLPWRPLLAYVAFNGVLVVLAASPAARRSCT
jgi:hypothetical protein